MLLVACLRANTCVQVVDWMPNADNLPATPLSPPLPPFFAAAADLLLAQEALHTTAGLLQASEALLHTTVCAAQAVAAVQLASLPPKLNTIIQPLVAAIRREPQPALQDAAAGALAALALLCVDRSPCPNDK